MRLQEQVREGRVGLVGALRGQRGLEGHGQHHAQWAAAGVVQLHAAQFAVVQCADRDRGGHRQIGKARMQQSAVGVELGAVFGAARGRLGGRGAGGGVGREGRGVRRRVRRQRLPAPIVPGLRPHDVAEHAVRVAQRIVAPARQRKALPLAEAGAVGAQCHGIAVVAQQVRRRQCTAPRPALELPPLALQRRGHRWCRALAHQRRQVRRALVQQRLHRAQVGLARGPAVRRAVGQHMGAGQQAHALVVGHEGMHRREARCGMHRGMLAIGRRRVGRAATRRLGGLAVGCVVQRLDETQVATRAQCFQRRQIVDGGARRHQQRQRAGIGRDDTFVGRRAAQRQAGHALRSVLVGQRVVLHRDAAFGHAPGRAALGGVLPLHGHRRARGLVEQAARRFLDHQAGHQVLEHRARPRAQADAVAVATPGRGEQRPRQHGPVRRRDVALGDGHQAGQPRFRGQQVVMAGVQAFAVDVVADVQQAPTRVVERAEVGRQRQRARALGQAVQASGQAGFDFAWCRGQAFAGRRQHQQMATEVAAVDSGDVGRRQRGQGLGVGPVVEVAVPARQAVQRVERVFQALRHFGRAYESHFPRRRHAQQVQADVGGRGAVRHHRLRAGELHVVGRQVVVFRADVAAVVGPGVTGQCAQMAAGVGVDALAGGGHAQAGQIGPQRRGGPQQAQRQHIVQRWHRPAGARAEDAQAQQRQQQPCGHQRDAAVAPPQRGQVGACGGLRCGSGGPLQQPAAAARLAPQRAADGVHRQPRVRQQLQRVPQRAAQGAQQLGAGALEEQAQRDVVARWRQRRQRAQQRPGAIGRSHQPQRAGQRQRAAGQHPQQQRQAGRRHQRAAQVVDHLPAVDGGHRPAPRLHDEGQQLPVAAQPPVQPRIGHVGVGGCVFDQGHVADRGAACQCAFQQVVAQHLFGRQALRQQRVHGVHVEQALAREGAFAEQVLVDLRARHAVGVDAPLAAEQPVKGRHGAGARQRHHHARLQDGVAAADAAGCRVQHRRVHRVGVDGRQFTQPAGGHVGVAVQRDHAAHAAGRQRQRAQVDEGRGERWGAGRRSGQGCGAGRAQAHQPAQQLFELAALAFPAHPGLFAV